MTLRNMRWIIRCIATYTFTHVHYHDQYVQVTYSLSRRLNRYLKLPDKNQGSTIKYLSLTTTTVHHEVSFTLYPVMDVLQSFVLIVCYTLRVLLACVSHVLGQLVDLYNLPKLMRYVYIYIFWFIALIR